MAIRDGAIKCNQAVWRWEGRQSSAIIGEMVTDER